jgi:hypothetical protein
VQSEFIQFVTPPVRLDADVAARELLEVETSSFRDRSVELLDQPPPFEDR